MIEIGTPVRDNPSYELLKKHMVRTSLTLQSIPQYEHRDTAGWGLTHELSASLEEISPTTNNAISHVKAFGRSHYEIKDVR
jgi:hypothetical protein